MSNSLSAMALSNGRFVVNAFGAPDYNDTVQSSTDLTTWTSMQTNPVPFQFTDSNALSFPIRSYRTLLVH